jgi:hypothetical protein
VKATDGLDLAAAETTLPCRIERAHLKWWLNENEPVILCAAQNEVFSGRMLFVLMSSSG